MEPLRKRQYDPPGYFLASACAWLLIVGVVGAFVYALYILN